MTTRRPPSRLAVLDHQPTHRCILAERALLAALYADYQSSVPGRRLFTA